MARSFSLALIAAIAALVVAEPTLFYRTETGEDSTTGPDQVVLLSYGEATSSLTFLYKGGSVASAEFPDGNLFSAGEPIAAAAGDYTNYTIPLTFDRNVGTEVYKFHVTTTSGVVVSIEGKFVVAGFVILNNDRVVSGDDGEGVSLGEEGTYTYKVRAIGTDGRQASLSDVSFDFKESSGPYMKEVDEGTTSISSAEFKLTLNKFRYGTGSFMISFEAHSIMLDGETFETVLNVKRESAGVPPCVAVAGEYEIDRDGYVAIDFFNLAVPPRESAVTDIVMSVGGKSYGFESAKSNLNAPDQTVYFKPETTGQASFTCDGAVAKITSGDTVTIKGSPGATEGPLAKDKVQGLQENENLTTITALISVVESSPDELRAVVAQGIADRVCEVTKAKSCVYTSITKGSAIVEVKGQTESTRAEEAEDLLRQSFTNCEFHGGVKNADFDDCNDVKLLELEVNAPKVVTGMGPATAAGLATWAIALIASIGALVVILLVVVALWAVYRRNAEQSESDYSSSGPLGVPDPSDLLYEQSIVRDIYGRGDFPEGGPSAAAAEARAREADLREEFPRPPSSSGVSRGGATDDASSTYSV